MTKINRFFTIILLLFLFSCTKQKKENTGITVEKYETFLIYGDLAPDGYLDGYTDSDTLTLKYGFLLKRIADCETDNVNIEATLKHNKKALKAMNKKYGEDWMTKFEKATNYKLAIPF